MWSKGTFWKPLTCDRHLGMPPIYQYWQFLYGCNADALSRAEALPCMPSCRSKGYSSNASSDSEAEHDVSTAPTKSRQASLTYAQPAMPFVHFCRAGLPTIQQDLYAFLSGQYVQIVLQSRCLSNLYERPMLWCLLVQSFPSITSSHCIFQGSYIFPMFVIDWLLIAGHTCDETQSCPELASCWCLFGHAGRNAFGKLISQAAHFKEGWSACLQWQSRLHRVDSAVLSSTLPPEKGPWLQVFFCSRTHSQLRQVIREITRTPFKDTMSFVPLGSRKVSMLLIACLDQSASQLLLNCVPWSKTLRENISCRGTWQYLRPVLNSGRKSSSHA